MKKKYKNTIVNTQIHYLTEGTDFQENKQNLLKNKIIVMLQYLIFFPLTWFVL